MKKILLLSLVLALVLTLILPSTALAANPSTMPFAKGKLIGIDEGTIKPVGCDSSRWLVKDRNIQVELQMIPGDPDKTISFTLTYGGVFKLADQSGNLTGILANSGAIFKVTGKVDPYTLVDLGGGLNLPKLDITGHWTGIRGSEASGDFSAWMIFVPTADGHVDYIVDSDFVMNKYN